VFLLDEPTQGVDVAAKAALHKQLLNAAEAGAVVVVSSSDVDELVALCHKVIVMRDGKVAALMEGTDVTVQRVLAECMATSAVLSA